MNIQSAQSIDDTLHQDMERVRAKCQDCCREYNLKVVMFDNNPEPDRRKLARFYDEQYSVRSSYLQGQSYATDPGSIFFAITCEDQLLGAIRVTDSLEEFDQFICVPFSKMIGISRLVSSASGGTVQKLVPLLLISESCLYAYDQGYVGLVGMVRKRVLRYYQSLGLSNFSCDFNIKNRNNMSYVLTFGRWNELSLRMDEIISKFEKNGLYQE